MAVTVITAGSIFFHLLAQTSTNVKKENWAGNKWHNCKITIYTPYVGRGPGFGKEPAAKPISAHANCSTDIADSPINQIYRPKPEMPTIDPC